MAYDYDLIIIGGGSGGLSLASGAAQLGVKTLLISAEMLGGDCLHYGCVPSKSLIKTSKLAHQIKHAQKYGLESTALKVDWSNVVNRIANIQGHIQKHDHPDRFRKLGCEVVFGTANFLGSHKVNIRFNPRLTSLQPEGMTTAGNAQVQGKKICIATGSHPRIPEIPGLKETGFITNEDVFRIREFPKKLAIIGGGVIASELAQSFTRLGSEVTILEQHAKFFGRFADDIANTMNQVFEEEGVKVLLNTEIEKVEKNDIYKNIYIKNSETGETSVLEAHEILVAAGRQPNTALDLGAAGVKFTERGITVDKKCRTNKKHITAIGDVNGKSMFTHTANYEAGIVLANEILHIPAKADYQTIGWTIYTDPEVASIGYSEHTVKKAKIPHTIVKFDFAKNDRALTESETMGFVKIIIDKKERVIGAQIVGSRAGEMIREWQLAINQKLKLSKIARSTFIYPTFGEASKWAAGSHYGSKLFSEKVRRWLRLFFRYRG